MFSSLNWKIKIRVSYDLAQSSRIKPNRSIRLYISYFSFLIKAKWDDCMCLVIERVGHNKSLSGIHYFVPKRSVESLDYGVGSIRAKVCRVRLISYVVSQNQKMAIICEAKTEFFSSHRFWFLQQ